LFRRLSAILKNVKLIVIPRTISMKYRVMAFSQDWRKLNDRFFATIRVHRGELKYAPDEMVEVQAPTKKFRAHVLLATDWKMKDIPLGFLDYDLEGRSGENREDLINKLAKLYKFSQKPKESDVVTIYFLERL